MKQETINKITNGISDLSVAFILLVFGAIFSGGFYFWTFIAVYYGLGMEVLITGGALLFYLFSLIGYVLLDFADKKKGGGKWENTTKTYKR